jgi:glycine betaine/proline transport system permease protein
MAWFFPQDASDFPNVGRQIISSTNDAFDWVVINFGWLTEGIRQAILQPLLFVEDLLTEPAPWIILICIAAITYAASRRMWLTAAVTGTTYLLGMLGYWEEAMETVSIMLIAVLFSVIIAIPVGVLSARSNRFKTVLMPILDVMQTIPPFVYLIPFLMLFGLGKLPAIMAAVVYATPPLVRLTDLGIREVSREVTEAARAFGATRWQMLRGVQLPLALPTIMQGINQTTMAALSMVVIASLVGASGLGEIVNLGLNRSDAGLGLVGGLGIVILAIVFDRITQSAGRRLQPYRAAGG